MDTTMASPSSASVSDDGGDAGVVVATILNDYFENGDTTKSGGSVLLSSIKVVIKLIQNASKRPMVRYNNPKIHQHVVQIPGALDTLALAGFAIISTAPTKEQPIEEKMLVYKPENTTTKICQLVCHQLETKLTELKFRSQTSDSFSAGTVASSHPTTHSTTAAPNTTNNTASPSPCPFLSEEERKSREKKAKAARKAKRLERSRALQMWKEDQEDRQLAAQCKRTAAAAMDTAMEPPREGIQIKPLLAEPTNAKRAAVTSPSMFKQGNGHETMKEAATKPTHVSRLLTAAVSSGNPVVPVKRVAPLAPAVSPENTDMDNSMPPPLASAPSADNDMDEADDMDKKPPARRTMLVQEKENETAGTKWKEYLEAVPVCGPAHGIYTSSAYAQRSSVSSSSSSGTRPACLRKLLRELDAMKATLPTDSRCSVWVRFDAERPQFIRAIMAAALPGPTPYSGGLFCFDIYVPDQYPRVPPKVVLLNTGGGSVRFGPNLYADGKVCLSLLGTWPGPKWNPRLSSISQVLLSIQGLVLGVEHPYFLEPGHGGWEGQIKEGEFIKTGQTLSGNLVKEEVGLPNDVILYEDKLRIGTLRFAMLEPLEAATTTTNTEMPPYLRPFRKAIKVHFHFNRDAVLAEVSSWLTHRPTIKSLDDRNTMEERVQKHIEQLQALSTKLETVLREMPQPNLDDLMKEEKTADDDEEEAEVDIEEDEDLDKKPAAVGSSDQKQIAGAAQKIGPLESLRCQMQNAASLGNFVEAGRRQAELHRIEELQRNMQDAAASNDFIRAGKLQEQLQICLNSIGGLAKKPTLKPPPPHSSVSDNVTGDTVMDMETDVLDNGGFQEDGDDDDDGDSSNMDSFGSDGEDDGWDSAGVPSGGMSTMFSQSLPPNAPAWAKNKYKNRHHLWGAGQKLSSVSAASLVASSGVASEEKTTIKHTTTDKEVKSKARRSGVVCRLRIRLPHNSTTIMETFDAEDTLADVYRRLEPHIPEEESTGGSLLASHSGRHHVMTAHGPRIVEPPAFSQPLSFKGYTLLLARPKREFSLEMHGTKTLCEMDLVPSATLTVMMCAARGVVRRGDLESRLSEAQGDAMDVEGLSYEGLLELTERLGVPDTAIDEASLEANSTLLSPAEYLLSLDQLSNEDKCCPICLGEFDPTDGQLSLRSLKNCPHTFHVACLATWMKKKSSCPICKQPILSQKENESDI